MLTPSTEGWALSEALGSWTPSGIVIKLAQVIREAN